MSYTAFLRRHLLERGPLDNPQFRAWFGASKVVDAHGQPLRVYHGTANDITAFGHERGNGSGSREGRLGHWFTDHPQTASDFAAFASPLEYGQTGPNVVPVYLRIINPWTPSAYKEIRQLVDRHTQFNRPPNADGYVIRMVQDRVDYAGAVQELKSAGHDGIILANTLTDSPDGETPINQYIVFDRNQIKSAFNSGGFSGSDHISESTDFAATVADIKRRYSDIRLDVRTSGNWAAIEWIENTSEEPGRAGKALTELCQAADQNSVTIDLEVAEGDPGLIAYYRRFDFELNHRPGELVTMTRLPTLLRMMRR